MLSCQDCPKKSTCTELCSEAEKFVNQDYVSREKQIDLLPDMDIFPYPEFDNGIWSYQKKRYTPEGLKSLIIQLYLDGKTPTEISYHIECSQPYIFKIITRLN